MRSTAISTSVSRQLEQAEKRYEVGLIAITDVQEARAAHDCGAAAVIAAKRQLASAQEAAARNHRRRLRVAGASESNRSNSPTPDPSSEERWVEMALQQNLSAGLEPPGGGHRARKRERGPRRPPAVARPGREPLSGDHRRPVHQRRRHAVRHQLAGSIPKHHRSAIHHSDLSPAAWCPLRCARPCTSIARRRSGWSASPAKRSTMRATPISACSRRFRTSRRCAARSNRTPPP